MSKCQFGLALECLYHAQDFGGLLLLATSAGDAGTMEKLSELSAKENQSNIGFLTNFLLGRLEVCLEILIKTGRLPEAAFFARTYLPSQISRSAVCVCVCVCVCVGVGAVSWWTGLFYRHWTFSRGVYIT